MRRIFVTGIGTGVGKTIVSAIITEALQADYWKPIQTGSIEGTDTETVKKLITNSKTKIHPEAYCLPMPVSPHEAAEAEGVSISLKNIHVPATSNTLIIEGAGGLMVPLNDKETMLDFIKTLNAEVILVVRNYLGSINHTLLSINAIKEKRIPLAGIIYNGQPNPSSEEAIEAFCKPHVIGRIGHENKFTPPIISKYAKSMYPSLKGLI